MINRRDFASASAVMSVLAPLASAQGASRFTQGSAAIDLAVAYYHSYNEGNWLAVSDLWSDTFRLKTNSGYMVETSAAHEDGIVSGFEKFPDGFLGASESIDFLRERRLKVKGPYYLDANRSQFFSPSPNVAICWMSKPGVTGPFGFPIPEVHIFRCDIRKVGEAITEAKILSLVEINLQNFEHM